MKIIDSIDEWKIARKNELGDSTVGFIPTMGGIHQGHCALIQKSLQDNDITVVSIFVNPTQFNDPNDFKNYPNTLTQDLEILSELGVDYLLLPKQAEIYPNGYQFKIGENIEQHRLEGKSRPGHFEGMLTIVLKLLNIVIPTCAYFGEKDYQQYQLIQKMCQDLFLDIKIIPCTTIRESDLLACSSRNLNLSKNARKKAAIFANIFHKDSDPDNIKSLLNRNNIEVDYVEIVDKRLFAAVKIDGVRLIDNREVCELS